jgi:GNAT superfamily N-acetyltransferase
MSKEKIIIRELNSKKEMISSYTLVNQMYPKMSFEDYKKNLDEMISLSGYKMVAAFLNGEMVGVTGYWVSFMLYCGRYIQASNLVVDRKKRSLGIGKKILHYLEKKGKKLGCEKLVLDSYTENKKSHSLYYREGFYIRGFHFMKNLRAEI